MRLREMLPEDIGASPLSIIELEHECIKRWNETGIARQPWGPDIFENFICNSQPGYNSFVSDFTARTAVSDRRDARSGKPYQKIVGYFCMRKTTKDEGEGWGVVAYGGIDTPGVGPWLAREILTAATGTRKRLNNLLVCSHGKASS